jgi:hypothetical protein
MVPYVIRSLRIQIERIRPFGDDLHEFCAIFFSCVFLLSFVDIAER